RGQGRSEAGETSRRRSRARSRSDLSGQSRSRGRSSRRWRRIRGGRLRERMSQSLPETIGAREQSWLLPQGRDSAIEAQQESRRSPRSGRGTLTSISLPAIKMSRGLILRLGSAARPATVRKPGRSGRWRSESRVRSGSRWEKASSESWPVQANGRGSWWGNRDLIEVRAYVPRALIGPSTRKLWPHEGHCRAVARQLR